MRFFHDTKINFIGKRGLFFTISLVVIAAGLIGTFVIGPVFGIDFAGGTEVVVRFDEQINADDVRDAVDKNFSGSEIKSFGSDGRGYSIRVKDSDDAPTRVKEALTNNLSLGFEEVWVKKIGPKIGGEMRTQAFIAIILSVFAILLYIAFRFEFTYGIGAIIALVHDVFITFSLIVIVHSLGFINLEINQAILAGLLTVVGFSINDTVIIFDRIRENLERHKGKVFHDLVNMSINETLSRTVNTTITSVLSLLAIIIFGGPVLQGFAFTMLIGFIVGTYSSIYIASSFVIWYLEKVKKVKFA